MWDTTPRRGPPGIEEEKAAESKKPNFSLAMLSEEDLDQKGKM